MRKPALKHIIMAKFEEHGLNEETIKWMMNSLYLGKDVDKPEGKDQKKHFKDHKTRKLFIQSFNGAYGIAGYVFTIEGSPPRGTILATKEYCFFDMPRMRKAVFAYLPMFGAQINAYHICAKMLSEYVRMNENPRNQ